ncbi:MAG: tRNA (cytidine(56)-2'-O)-methyltransferase [Thermoplasmata archaeon]|nr:tRNA (cytidine(56)-2'-O)-methyltransferase [Thermoplasmata archaeon]
MITVLRIGHRPERDKRITTHIALTARAFGANEVLVDYPDKELENTFESTCQRWGGDLKIRTGVKWRQALKEFKGQIVHLTMYGETLEKAIQEINSNQDIMIVVGAEKVPREVYEMASINVGVGNQPHSEVAALGVFLYALFYGNMPEFNDGQMKIIPNPRGKTVESND